MKNTEILNQMLEGSLEPDTTEPIIQNGVRYRYATSKDLKDIIALEAAWHEGWDETWGENPAFPEEWMEADLEKFPGLQILAIRERTGEALGKISAVRFDSKGVDPDVFASMSNDEDWDEIYENQRGPEGTHVEGSGLAVKARGLSDIRGIAANLATYMIRAVAEASLKGPEVERFTYQSRNPGFRKWLEKEGLDPTSDALHVEHARYVDAALSGEIAAPVLGIYAGFLDQVEEIKMINKNANWPGDYPSCELGVRFDATAVVNAVKAQLSLSPMGR